jgi:hypothetical protein
LRGDIDLAAWPILWSRYLGSAVGIVNLDFTVKLDQTRVSGTMVIARDLVLRTPHWPSPITLPAGGQVQLDGDTVTTSGLSLATSGLSGRIAGTVTVDRSDLRRSHVALALNAQLDAARVPLRLPAGIVAQGQASLDVLWTGTLGQPPGPHWDGRASFDNLVLQSRPRSPRQFALPTLRVDGAVDAHGNLLSTIDLHLTIGGVGDVAVGRPSLPAQAELLSLLPPRLGHIDVPVAGTNLTIGGPSSPLSIRDLDADLRLVGSVTGPLRLEGNLAVAQGAFDPSRAPAHGRSNKGGTWYRALPPNLTLDLWLHGPKKAMRVAVPVLPDVTIDFQCHLLATKRGATMNGRVRGDSLYAKAAVHLYDWFTPGDLRGCQLP